MADIEVSVIVPIYNAEKYLRKCIDSILDQTLKHIECILVDDGSVDNSYAICKEYEIRDSRIRVIRQKNSGSSVARNTGINMSNGKYISFVDSDDWIESTMLEKLSNNARKYNADISICNHSRVYSKHRIIPQPISNKGIWILNNEDDINIYLRKFLCKGVKEYRPYLPLGQPWGRIYKAQIIKENNLYFPIGLHRSEDGIFNMYAAKYSHCICFTDEILYYYRILDNSISHKLYSNIVMDTEKDFYEVRKFRDTFMKQDKIFNEGIYVRITTWFYKYLKHFYFTKQFICKYGYFRARKEIINLLKREPYVSAYQNVNLKLMRMSEIAFVVCMKCRFIEIAYLFCKLREWKKYIIKR